MPALRPDIPIELTEEVVAEPAAASTPEPASNAKPEDEDWTWS
jgi:hypothetical protein